MQTIADLLHNQKLLNVITPLESIHWCCNVIHLSGECVDGWMPISNAERQIFNAIKNFVDQPKHTNAWKQTHWLSQVFPFCGPWSIVSCSNLLKPGPHMAQKNKSLGLEPSQLQRCFSVKVWRVVTVKVMQSICLSLKVVERQHGCLPLPATHLVQLLRLQRHQG